VQWHSALLSKRKKETLSKLVAALSDVMS